MNPIIPYSHHYWVGGPPKLFLMPARKANAKVPPPYSFSLEFGTFLRSRFILSLVQDLLPLASWNPRLGSGACLCNSADGGGTHTQG